MEAARNDVRNEMGLKEAEEIITTGMFARGIIAAVATEQLAIDEQRAQARLSKMLRVTSQNQAHDAARRRNLKDDRGRESNEDFYRGCHPPGDAHNRHNVDTFVVPYVYNLYNDRPKIMTTAGGLSPASIEILNMVTIHKSIRAIDELIEYYVIDSLNVHDCSIDGLYMIDRSPTDHVLAEAIGAGAAGTAGADAGSVVDITNNPLCHNTTDTLCVPIKGGITVEYDANIVSKEVLQNDVLTAIQYAMDRDKLLPEASGTRKAVFIGPEHLTVDRSSVPKKHQGLIGEGANDDANDIANSGANLGTNGVATGNKLGGNDPIGGVQSEEPRQSSSGDAQVGDIPVGNARISDMLPTNNDNAGSSSKDNTHTKTAGITSSVLLIMAACLLALYIRRRKKKSEASLRNDEQEEVWAQEIDDIDADTVFYDGSVRRLV